ncbi:MULTISPECIES: hexitol phosphatase HxpB [Myroides]|uniref:hexitol phosphatase HxpB n=1 Tax=Myroides TaxID=76831 RepID=UPI001326CACD|nr:MULTISPECIES: hexitol phosphatase HxpB [Myroides]MVX35364.1 hexitol phosphatase HxpB [Myroides sp. LoEW2-1]UVD78306.1 hexitol phosphatase HxpB [Myroides albus]
MIDTVIFDMDGTLIDSEKFWQQAEREVFTELGAVWEEEIAHQTTGKTVREVTELWYSMYPWEGKTFEEVEKAVIDRVGELIQEQGEAKVGVVETLKFLKQNGIKIGLATNSTVGLIDVAVDKLNIRSYFETLVSAFEVPNGKPAPDVYLKAAANLGSLPIHCAAVEDSITGSQSGRNAGMTVIAIPDNLPYDDERFNFVDYKLHSMLDFEKVISPILKK